MLTTIMTMSSLHAVIDAAGKLLDSKFAADQSNLAAKEIEQLEKKNGEKGADFLRVPLIFSKEEVQTIHHSNDDGAVRSAIIAGMKRGIAFKEMQQGKGGFVFATPGQELRDAVPAIFTNDERWALAKPATAEELRFLLRTVLNRPRLWGLRDENK